MTGTAREAGGASGRAAEPQEGRAGTALRALVELRGLLFVRRLRGFAGVAEGAALFLVLLVALPLGLLFAFLVGAGSYRAARAGHGLPTQLGVTAIFFGLWQAWTAVSLSLNEREGFDLRRHLLYPLPPGRLWLLGMAGGLAGDPISLFWLLLLGGAFGGAALGRPGPWLALLAVDVALFAVATVLLVALVQEVLGRILASRRIRELAIGAGLALVAWAAVGAGGRGTPREILATLDRLQWIAYPAALAAAGARRLYGGEVARSLPWVLGLAAAAALTGFAAFRLALAGARGGEGARPAPAPRPGKGWRLPGLGPAAAGLLEREAKHLARHPLARVYAVIVPTLSALLAWKLVPLFPAEAGEVVRALPLFGLALYTHLVLQIFWLNGFGWERGGARSLYLAPLRPERVLLAKNGALYAVSLGIFGASLLGAGLVAGWPPGWALLGALALHLGLAPYLFGLGNLVTVLNPRAAPAGLARSGALSWLSGLAGMAILSGASGLFALPALLALRLEEPWLLPAAWGLLGAAGLAAYLRTLPAAGELLSRRREQLLAAVCGDEA